MHTIKIPSLLTISFQLCCFILFLVWLSSSLAQSLESQSAENIPPLTNHLKNSPSPYLALHGDDPVAWQPWSPATLARARKENKLLFVSLGYFSCHWCHVMQAESYKNAEIAALINQNFIPVKVDRELEVALDAEMIAYAQGILGTAGWPLNVFITPDGYPLYAILYEQPERFKFMLGSLSQEWKKDSAGLKAIAKNSVNEKLPGKKIKPSFALAEKYHKQLVQETLALTDMLSGGLNVPRKFPLSPQLAVLLEIEARQHDAKLAEWLQLTLDQMMDGGLRDHVAGGFFRYTVDPNWQQPHFEKMLYDNTQLAMIYLRAATIFHRPAYRDIAIETLDFMLKEMRVGGGFITSISAVNSRGEEGASYLWTKEQLKAILENDEYPLISKIWGMGSAAEFEFGYLPMSRKQAVPAESKRLKLIYAKLLQHRQQRDYPKDIKLLVGLNGMALAAFSEAADTAPRFKQAADELRSFVINLWQNGELLKGISKQQSLGLADLDGYAYTASGLLRYAQQSKNIGDAKIAVKIAQAAWHKFYSHHGFVLEQKSVLARPYYQEVIEDGPLPSPSSVLIDVSLKSGDKGLKDKAHDALGFGAAMQRQGLFWHASQVMALSRLFPVKIE